MNRIASIWRHIHYRRNGSDDIAWLFAKIPLLVVVVSYDQDTCIFYMQLYIHICFVCRIESTPTKRRLRLSFTNEFVILDSSTLAP